ncbi:MAG: type II toxin-antitoxin system RelE/ParE family toxin [Chloroflexota bacterium]|nr:type II toxin-antitoxin system RelE/ParE family toxin [Chloroflexota bacterium]
MGWSVRIKNSAAKEVAAIPQPARGRIIEAIDSLGEQPLAGAPLRGALRGLRRVRVGDYRIVYQALDDEMVVLVVRAAHRRDVYRRA